MKKFKAILALLLVAVMVCALFAACAKNGGTSSGSDSTSTPGSADSTGSTDNTKKTTYAPEDVVNIVVAYLDVAGNEDSEWDRVVEYMNTITEPTIGAHVSVIHGKMGDYGTNIPLMIAGNEQLDVVNISPLGGTKLANLLANNSLMDCKSLLETWAPGALAVCADYLDTYTRGDALYGLPTNRAHTSNEYLILRKDILEATGTLELAQNMSAWSEIEELFAKVNDYCRENNMYVIGGQKSCIDVNAVWFDDKFDDMHYINNLGDSSKVLMSDADGKVLNKFEHESIIDMMKRAVTWTDKGYVYPDTILGDDHADNLFKQGVIFSYWNHTEVGVEAARKLSSGYDVVAPMVGKADMVTTNFVTFGVAIPVCSQEPEAAARFIELLYTDPRIVTCFAWGVQDEDFAINDEGEAYKLEGTAFQGQDYMIGNQFLVAPWQGSGGNLRQVAEATNKAAKKSAYLGFIMDTNGLETTIAGVTAVSSEFNPEMLSGQYTQARYDEYMNKLYAAGLQEYIDAVQSQLDAWLAAK